MCEAWRTDIHQDKVGTYAESMPVIWDHPLWTRDLSAIKKAKAKGIKRPESVLTMITPIIAKKISKIFLMALTFGSRIFEFIIG